MLKWILVFGIVHVPKIEAEQESGGAVLFYRHRGNTEKLFKLYVTES